ncbi:MAG: PilZ domain-containing protein [Pseudomonadota bacterium]
MNIKRPLIHLICWSLLSGLILPVACAAADAGKPVFRIGVVYRVGDTGNRILSGVTRAVERYSSDNGKFQVEVEKYPYLDENAGIDSIFSIFDDKDKKSIHLILGPSDSGIFVEMAQRAEYEEKASLPVVSPLVTAQEGNTEGDWRFRTNVDIEARSRAISDYLSHAGYQATGVLYRDNEFGKRAAEAFKSQFLQAEEDYLALPYADELDLRGKVRKILEQRPGAVGVFGRRHELKFVKREFEALNSGWFDYRPLLFSINDTRALKLADTHFVSLVGPNSKPPEGESPEIWDEVRGLAHDTTLLVLRTAEQIPRKPARGAWAESFKKRLFTRMLGPPQSDRMFKTSMEFSDGKNLSPPLVLKLSAEAEEQIAVPGHSLRELWKLGDWIEIRQQRYGLAIWFNLGIVIIVAIWLTLADIRRRQTIRSRGIYFCKPILALILFNVVCAATTLIVIAETEVIRWDNVLAALGVAVGYRAMLTTTIFETAQGRALGFGRLYERTLASINERIMLTLYEKQSAAINYVTHTNSRPNMRDLLINIYSFAHDGTDSQARIRELDAEIGRAKGALKQQEVCARRLLQTMSWKQLQDNRIIPDYIKQDELIDPIVLLRDAVQFVMQGDQELKARVNTYIDETLAQLKQDSTKNHEQVKEELKEALDKSQTERGRLYCRLRWLFTQWGFSLRRIKVQGLLPQDYRTKKSRLRKWPDRWRRGKQRQTEHDTEDAGTVPGQTAATDRRDHPRIPIDAKAQLKILDEGHTLIREVDAALSDVSKGGARLLIDPDGLEEIALEQSALSIRISRGPLAGIDDAEAQHVHHFSCGDLLEMGVAWSDPSSELSERITELAA